MTLYLKGALSQKYKKEIERKFNFLLNFFNFKKPGDIFVEILPLKNFDKKYELEKGKKPDFFVVGFASNNGRVFILDKNDFEKKNHKKEEFEGVILHELSHIFIRRILWPKKTYMWIEEGLCQYLSFKKNKFKVKKFVSFKKLESKEDWNRNPSYQQSAKFFEFLNKKFGKEKIVLFIKNIRKLGEINAFKKVFNKTIKEIEKEFYEKI